MGSRVADIMVLIGQALWREVVTYWYSWPHEYVVVKRGGQEALLAAFCARIAAGEGVECRFFAQTRQYLFLGGYKYWTMTNCSDINLDGSDYVLNRALLYRGGLRSPNREDPRRVPECRRPQAKGCR